MKQSVELRTERILLRPFTLDDVDDVLEYINDPEWAEYQVNIQSAPYTRKDVETLVEMFSDPSHWETGHPELQPFANGAGLLQILAVVFEGKVIGEIALNQRDEDRRNERVELAYTLSRQHWNKGLMTDGFGTCLSAPTAGSSRTLAGESGARVHPRREGQGSPPDAACESPRSHLQARSPSTAQAIGAYQGRPGLDNA